MAGIHATAIVVPGAKLGAGVTIGPYCIVGGNVVLGDGVELVSHVIVDGHTRIGSRTKIYPFASLGQGPQHLKYAGEPTRLEIGADNVIREYVTMNTGTVDGGGVTVPAPARRWVRVRFSPPDVEADDVVLDLVAQLPSGRPVIVVSSDNRVREGARRGGANLLYSRQLLDTLGVGTG